MNVAEELRLSELRALKVLRDDGLVDQALKQLNERGGAQELVRQQYSGRYPFELLQNANDAARQLNLTEGRRAHFLLTESALIVADDGAGFGDEQIRSICSLGASSKGPGEAIGHKGLGFKSVGEITDRPQIVSRGGEFQFDGARVRRDVEEILGDAPRGQRFPVYAFPYPMADSDLGSDADEVRRLLDHGFVTVIRLPFRPDVERASVAHDLVNQLNSDLLLFLPSIGQLELRGTDEDFVATILHERSGIAWNALLDVDGEQEQWLIYRHEFSPDPDLLEPLGERWTDVDALHMSVAVLCDDEGQPRSDVQFPLSVYFPTEVFAGLPVNAHAEWILTLDRKHVSSAPEAATVNAAIRDVLSNFVGQVVAPDLVERSGLTPESIHALLPSWESSATVTPGFGADLRKAWIDALARSNFLPTTGGTLRPPAEVRVLPDSIADPDEAHRFANLDETTVRPDLESITDLRRLVSETSPEFGMTIRQYAENLRTPAADELGRYYAFLMACQESAGLKFTRELSKVPCVLTSHDDWVSPAVETVFLPRVRSEDEVPEDIPVPIAVVPEGLPGIERFLEALGVRAFQWRTIIEDFLMPILRDPNEDEERREHALNSLRAYQAQRRGEEPPLVLQGVLLPARGVDNVRALRRSGELYFGAYWTGSADLETLYGPFGGVDFLDVAPPEDPESLVAERGFYEMLGVAGFPRLSSIVSGGGVPFEHYSHPHRYDSGYTRWLYSPDVWAVAQGCPSGHPQSQRLRESHQIDRLPEILDSEDPVRLAALWRQLGLHWAIYQSGMHAVFHCVASGNHPAGRDRTADSLFAFTLRSHAWIPVVLGGTRELATPREAWYDAPDVPRSIRDRVPRVPAEMLDGVGLALARELGLTDAARPDVDDLLLFLDTLAADAETSAEVSRELTYAAKWVQRRLNDQLHPESDPHPDPQSVRVLATQHRTKTFVPQPAFTSDSLLRRTWSEYEPVLEAEGQPRALVHYLSLDNLDNSVRTEPRPEGVHQVGSEADIEIRTHFDRRKAEVLALISADVPSVEESAASRLRTLELVVCEELELRYVGRGREVPRPDAPCYISVRREQKGRRRRIGTAYLRLLPDDANHRPDWYAFAAQLAEFLDTPLLADAVATIFTASRENRWSMLAQHSVELSDVDDARRRLQQPDIQHDDLDALTASFEAEVVAAGAPEPSPHGSREVAQEREGTAAPTTSESPETEDPATPTEGPMIPPEPRVPFTPPPIDYAKVRVFDAHPGALAKSRPTQPGSRRPGSGSSKAPSIQTEQLKRDVGARGEEAAFEAERRRLQAIDLSPDLVDWISRRDELSPYDMTSVEDGQRIFIEVKATTGSDPSEPFQISRGELVQAAIHRDRFFIYRVTDAFTDAPVVTRFPDPFGLVTEGKGEILLSKASMTLIDESSDAADDDGVELD